MKQVNLCEHEAFGDVRYIPILEELPSRAGVVCCTSLQSLNEGTG